MRYKLNETMGQERPQWIDNVQKAKLFLGFGAFGILALFLLNDIRKRGI